MGLFKLEIPIPGRILGHFPGNETLGRFLKCWDPQKALRCARARRLTYRSRQNRPRHFCWVRWQETNKRKKNNTKLMLTLCGRGPFNRLMMSFGRWGVHSNSMNCVEFGFDRSRGFGSVRDQFWPIAIDWPIRPYNIASPTVQQVIIMVKVEKVYSLSSCLELELSVSDYTIPDAE
jgi:hypothetical protein